MKDKDFLSDLKNISAREVGVTLKKGYNGDLTAKQTGSVGGQMVKTIIQHYKQNIQTGK